MDRGNIYEEVERVLKEVCVNIGERPTGSKKNRQLEDYARLYFVGNGFDVETQQFECINWENRGANLYIAGKELDVKPSYYTTACSLEAEYITLGSDAELERSNLKNRIAVLYDELTAEQLMPKGFAFYNPIEHQKTISFLEEKEPSAIITVVHDNTSIFEDGDFDIPSAYVTEEEGDVLLKGKGKISLEINTSRRDAGGANLIARINPDKNKKLVVTAHIDTKHGTPGALDNGTGVVILLLLSSIIKPEDIDFSLELLLLNGEDYYSTPGQLKYLEEYIIGDKKTFLAINCDGIGLKDSKTAVSFLELSKSRKVLLEKLISKREGVDLIEPWEMGDHMLFVMNGIPAVTITSKEIFKSFDEIVHTERDSIDIIDRDKIIKVINFIAEFITNVEK